MRIKEIREAIAEVIATLPKSAKLSELTKEQQVIVAIFFTRSYYGEDGKRLYMKDVKLAVRTYLDPYSVARWARSDKLKVDIKIEEDISRESIEVPVSEERLDYYELAEAYLEGNPTITGKRYSDAPYMELRELPKPRPKPTYEADI